MDPRTPTAQDLGASAAPLRLAAPAPQPPRGDAPSAWPASAPVAVPAAPQATGLFSRLCRMMAGRRHPDSKNPGVYLAAFGKHPGWDDHVLDLGVETDQLVSVQRSFYVRGIGENIDKGSWEKLAPEDRLPEFRHEFLWRKGTTVFAARLWASRDGKMRARYPMILCAQFNGLPMDWVAATAPDLLEQAKQRCAATTSADEVRATVTATQSALREAARAAAARTPPAGPAPVDFPADREELGPARRGLYAILHEVERNMAAYRPASPNSSTQTLSPLARNVRVPSFNLLSLQASRLWIEFLATQLSRSAGILAIHPIGENWVDLIVGDPAPENLFCLLATPKRIPFTSDIPYKVEEEFKRRCDQLIDQNRRPPDRKAE